MRVVYRRYASLFFIVGTDPEEDNELGMLEFIHALVETLDKYFENVCELDIMFNLEKAQFILGKGGGGGGGAVAAVAVAVGVARGMRPKRHPMPMLLLTASACERISSLRPLARRRNGDEWRYRRDEQGECTR